jgi:hypothetical protein
MKQRNGGEVSYIMLNHNKQEVINLNQNSQPVEPDRVSLNMNGGFTRPGRDGSAILLATSNAFGLSDNNENSNGQTVIDEVDVDEEARSGGTDVNWEKKAIFDYDDDELSLLAKELGLDQDDEDLFNTMNGSIIVNERV